MILIPLVIFIILFGIFPNIVLNFLKVPHFLILETFKWEAYDVNTKHN